MGGRLHDDWFVPALFAVAINTVCIAPALAGEIRAFSVPAGRLSDGLITLAQQGGISIVLGDPKLDSLRTRGLSGRYEVADALRRLLAGSGYDAVFIDARTVRLVRRPPAPHAARAPDRVPVVPPHSRPVLETSGPDIVVTATKQRIGLADYPASVAVVEPTREELARAGGRGTGYILGKLPELSSTNLGPGRNKIFIRGIADSSFNGTSQATISQYLGDLRLIYSAPDPDLALHDITRVEVLEGPQGTLYGAGTLGGIIRLVPTPPDPNGWSAEGAFGLRFTQKGEPGGDGALVANVPIVARKLALRTVVYRTVDGGYIDDARRGLSDINRNSSTGLRATLRWQPDAAWTADLTLVGQNLNSRDGQYTLRGEPDLTRSSYIAQPFDNDYRLIGLTVSRDWDRMQLVSATGYARQSIDTVFDATVDPDEIRKYEEDIGVRLFSHETRLTGQWGTRGTWLAGVSLLHNTDHAARSLGAPDAPEPLSSVSNVTLDAAVFGEVGVPLGRTFQLTLGGRYSYVRQTSEFMGSDNSNPEDIDYEPLRRQKRFLPSAALAWKPRAGLLLYGRYQQGYRPGGLQVTGSATDPSADRFVSDRIETMEVGLRFGMEKGARLSGSLAASVARWRDIQADLVGVDGLPYIANIGSGRVRNVALSLAWHPVDALSFEAAGFLNSSNLSDPAPGFDNVDDRDLPNIADEGWRTAVKYTHGFGWANLTADAALRYVGHSKLAIVAPFALGQGRYYDLSMGARLGFGRWGLSLDIDNALDQRGNTFAFGNPFTVADGLQQTPMRPRSVRLGVDATF
ncbi:outer membrane receptor protein involved in Fe transport [Novosphingobium sp. PhB165]|uniref:TonB-dependent receptor domain-containing protein n=1 Tax=Novosphingobium sp. PhB165 TaxID=2485105 RepID=UPI00104790F3|nr:TonB-dependent receptor [Novosphingobium sp. PhB165]TCM20897.1 outer membrane receptor protein involved in Fe transport [Novosphingobium sp. PhB165]